MNREHVMLSAGSTVGPYELLECIGRGGMADVYLGIKRSVSNIRRFYAIKAIRPHMAGEEKFSRMFVDEARVMANIRHPNLVALHEVIEEKGHYFIIMDYLRGIDLRRLEKELQSRNLQLPLAVAIGIVRQAALGLHYAHDATSIDGHDLALVHRDISPHNLFLTFDGYVRVLDFGIAQSSVRQELSESGILMGKIPYLSPEQCRDMTLDRRTDVYSLGVVLYELTTGRRPFRGKTEMQVIQSIVEEAAPRPVSINSGIPWELEKVILKALSKDREQRYQTAEELSNALEEVALAQHWHIGERVVGAFLRNHYREYMDELNTRLSELAAAAASADSAASEFIQIDYDEVEERLLDLGPDVYATSRRVGAYTLFSLVGSVRESFDYEPILERVRGVCVLNLMEVNRLTSFGIRQWLEMIPRLRDKADRIVLSQVSVPFVNQIVTIPTMAEGVEIESLMVPYRCRSCVNTFDHRIRAGEAIQWQIICPRCDESAAEPDEDPSFLQPLAGLDGVEEELRLLIDETSRANTAYESRIEKRVVGRTTEIVVSGEVKKNVRWDRYLAGVEGEVRIAFDPGVVMELETFSRLCTEVRRVSRDANIGIWNAPATPDDIDASEIPQLRSISYPSECPICGFEQFREWVIDSSGLSSSCRQCTSHLEQLFERPPIDEPQAVSADEPVDETLETTSTEVERDAPRSSSTYGFIIIVALLIAVIAAAVAL